MIAPGYVAEHRYANEWIMRTRNIYRIPGMI